MMPSLYSAGLKNVPILQRYFAVHALTTTPSLTHTSYHTFDTRTPEFRIQRTYALRAGVNIKVGLKSDDPLS